MRAITGLLWAFGGVVAGLIAGVLVGMLVVKLGNVTSREGAAGYTVIGIALIGGVIGAVAGIAMYARSAPAGQGAAFGGSAVLGVFGLVAAVALSLWGFMTLREAPLEYNGAQANLEMELRMQPTDTLPGSPSTWLDIEVQTARTRPLGTVLTSSIRNESGYLIIPVVEGPLYRSGQRVIAVRVGERQTEVFMPTMKRTPDPRADWSAWERPRVVDPPYGVTPSTPLKSMLELRYRVRPYGE